MPPNTPPSQIGDYRLIEALDEANCFAVAGPKQEQLRLRLYQSEQGHAMLAWFQFRQTSDGLPSAIPIVDVFEFDDQVAVVTQPLATPDSIDDPDSHDNLYDAVQRDSVELGIAPFSKGTPQSPPGTPQARTAKAATSNSDDAVTQPLDDKLKAARTSTSALAHKPASSRDPSTRPSYADLKEQLAYLTPIPSGPVSSADRSASDAPSSNSKLDEGEGAAEASAEASAEVSTADGEKQPQRASPRPAGSNMPLSQRQVQVLLLVVLTALALLIGFRLATLDWG